MDIADRRLVVSSGQGYVSEVEWTPLWDHATAIRGAGLLVMVPGGEIVLRENGLSTVQKVVKRSRRRGDLEPGRWTAAKAAVTDRTTIATVRRLHRSGVLFLLGPNRAFPEPVVAFCGDHRITLAVTPDHLWDAALPPDEDRI
jgi:hypothetical protein